MKRTLISPAPGDQRWLRVEDPSAAAGCRAAATALAGRLEFPADRTDQLVLAVTEAASNLHKHASRGSMLLRITRAGDGPGIEMVTIDAGPGLRDASAAMRDGHSTSGTLGIGLGAIQRLADFCDLYSVPGHGTVLVARFWPEPRSGPGLLRRAGPADRGGNRVRRRLRRGGVGRDADRRPVRRPRPRPAGRDRRQ